MNLQALQILLKKDLRLEQRRLDAWLSLLLFGVLLVVLTSMSLFSEDATNAYAAPAILWITTLFASTLLVGRAWAHEHEFRAGDLVWLSPTPSWAVFISKLMITFLLSSIVQFFVVLCTAILLHIQPWSWSLWLTLWLGNLGFLSLGTLLGSLSTRAKLGDVALTIALFPLASPAVLAGVVATRELLINASSITGWIRILGVFDLVALTLALWLFEPLHRQEP